MREQVGQRVIHDEPRPGCPISHFADREEAAVKTMVMGDRRLMVMNVALELGLPYTTVHCIMTERLGLHKVCPRWVSKPLTAENKARRVECCKQILAIYEDEPEKFFQCSVTGDETLIQHPESKKKN